MAFTNEGYNLYQLYSRSDCLNIEWEIILFDLLQLKEEYDNDDNCKRTIKLPHKIRYMCNKVYTDVIDVKDSLFLKEMRKWADKDWDAIKPDKYNLIYKYSVNQREKEQTMAQIIIKNAWVKARYNCEYKLMRTIMDKENDDLGLEFIKERPIIEEVSKPQDKFIISNASKAYLERTIKTISSKPIIEEVSKPKRATNASGQRFKIKKKKKTCKKLSSEINSR